MNLYEMPCVYGNLHQRDTVFIYEKYGYAYYCVKGSYIVNVCCIDDLKAATTNGVLDVEITNDVDTSSSLNPINSLSELEDFVDM